MSLQDRTARYRPTEVDSDDLAYLEREPLQLIRTEELEPLETVAPPDERHRPAPDVRRRGWLIRRLLVAGDLLALAGTFAVVELLAAPQAEIGMTGRLGAYALTALAAIAVFALSGLYGQDEIRADHTTPDDLPALLQAVTLGGFAGCAIAWAAGEADGWIPAVLLGWLLLVVLMPLGRSVNRAVARRHPAYEQQTIILGAGDIGQLMARKLISHPEYGLHLVGFLDDDPRQLTPELSQVPVLGGVDDVLPVVAEHRIERVIVAFSGVPHAETLDVIRLLKSLDVQIDIVPRLFEVVGPNVGLTTIEGLPVVVVPPLRLSRSHLFVKRVVDAVAAAAGLLVLSPVLAVIALAIRREGRGPLLFAGERVGAQGRMFRQLKFRTMKLEFSEGAGESGELAAARFRRVLDANPLMREEFERTQKLADDPRVTRVGRFLRRTSLDELPQLWNVLRGDLSLVGPRPITMRELQERYRPRILEPLPTDTFLVGYWDSPGLRPGLTGYWQISGRSKMSFDERIRLDTAYLTSWSLRLDLEILAKTLRILATSRGAY